MNQHHSIENIRLWTALVTPFEQSGAIDFASLARIARQQAAAGNGILLLGSTGEALALSDEQQYAIVKYVCELNLDTPLMIGVGGFQLGSQIAWMERCNQLPIAAYLLGAPLYAKPGVKGQHHWFESLLNASEHPCMLYNVPSRSGISLAPQALAALQSHPNCWALKEASGDIEQFLEYRQMCPEVTLFSGEDALMPYLAVAGAAGLVSVAANAWPVPTHLYVEQCLSGDINTTNTLFHVWKEAIASLFSVVNPVPVKVLMHNNGDIDSPNLLPPLIHHELTEQQSITQANDNIHQWYQAQTTELKQRA